MGRNWIMLRNRVDKRNQDVLRNFLAFTCDNIYDGTSSILRPCQDCPNTTFPEINAFQYHLFGYGFDISYQRWSFHGESLSAIHISRLESSNVEVVDDNFEDEDDMIGMLSDLRGANVGTASSSIEPDVEQIHR